MLKWVPNHDLLRLHLNDLSDYIDKVIVFLIKNDNKIDGNDQIQTLKESFQWINESATAIEKNLSKKIERNSQKALQMLRECSVQKLNLSNRTFRIELLKNLTILKNYFLHLSKLYTFSGLQKNDLKCLLDEFKEETKKVLDDLEEIATHLTVGNENQAILSIESLVTFLSDGLNILYLNECYAEEREKIMTILNELTNSLYAGNIVNSADLIDYDLREVLEVIVSNK